MWATAYWGKRYWAQFYWPESAGGGGPVVPTGGDYIPTWRPRRR